MNSIDHKRSSASSAEQQIQEAEARLEKLRAEIAKKEHDVRNINDVFHEQLTFGERLADNVAKFGGSWSFIILCVVSLCFWIFLNTVILVTTPHGPFDPFPFILLNLVLSMLAAIQAPVIMMSQNRQAAKDRLEAENDYGVNLKSELQIIDLHEKLDDLRETKWAALIEMQQQQIVALTRLLEGKAAESDR